MSRDDKARSHILAGVAQENRSLASGSLAPDRTPVPPPRHRRRWRLYALALLGLALGAAAIHPELIATARTLVPEPPVAQNAVPAPDPARARAPRQRGARTDPRAPAPPPAVEPADYRALVQAPDSGIAELFGLDVKTIVIDPGHGGRDPGAIGPTGIYEKDVTLDIAKRLRDRLADHGNYEVFLTREADETLALRERVEIAKARQADLFISVHINHLPVEPLTVVETYYFGPHSDQQSMELARYENRGSGYTMGAFKNIIENIGDTLKQQESKRLARSIQRSLVTNLEARTDRDIDNWGIKTAPFVVLLGVDAPSVLAEVTSLSNREEAERLATEAYREQIAAYLEHGIVRYLSKKQRTARQTQGEGDSDGEAQSQEETGSEKKG